MTTTGTATDTGAAAPGRSAEDGAAPGAPTRPGPNPRSSARPSAAAAVQGVRRHRRADVAAHRAAVLLRAQPCRGLLPLLPRQLDRARPQHQRLPVLRRRRAVRADRGRRLLALVLLWLNRLLLTRVPPGARRRAVRVLVPAAGLIGVVLVVLAFADLLTEGRVFGVNSATGGLCLAIGVILLVYAVRLLRLFVPAPAAGRRAATGMAEWGAAFLLVSIGLFWAADAYAFGVGTGGAITLHRALPTVPEAVLYSQQSLSLDVPGVTEVRCSEPDAAYAFRYDGLRLVRQAGNQYLLLPATWDRATGSAVLIPRSARSAWSSGPPGRRRPRAEAEAGAGGPASAARGQTAAGTRSRKPSTVRIRPLSSTTATSNPAIGASWPAGPSSQVKRSWSWWASTGPASRKTKPGNCCLHGADRRVEGAAPVGAPQRVGVADVVGEQVGHRGACGRRGRSRSRRRGSGRRGRGWRSSRCSFGVGAVEVRAPPCRGPGGGSITSRGKGQRDAGVASVRRRDLRPDAPGRGRAAARLAAAPPAQPARSGQRRRRLAPGT